VTVIGNLVDNAIDASADTGSGGRRVVRAGLHADEREIVVDVSDTGPGLSRHVLESAFTRGWSTKVSASTAGRGLGLALVSQVVRKHDGTIAVSTAELGGARFTVRLPVRQILTS
jgi:sensor histidine kinase regulating citrate/malate metabolism